MSDAPAPAGLLVRDFHERFGLTIRDQATASIPEPERRLRTRLLIEEVVEQVCAMEAVPVPEDLVAAVLALLPATPGTTTVDLHNLALEIADVTFVNAGTALHFGVDHDAAVAAVHAANLTRLPVCGRCADRDGAPGCPDCGGSGLGAPSRRPDGKILKPDTFRPADLTPALLGS